MAQNIMTFLHSSTVGKLQPVITANSLLTIRNYVQLCPQCRAFVNETLLECLIGEGGPLNWLAHSPNLTAVDFYL